jgi:hypothetical protein
MVVGLVVVPVSVVVALVVSVVVPVSVVVAVPVSVVVAVPVSVVVALVESVVVPVSVVVAVPVSDAVSLVESVVVPISDVVALVVSVVVAAVVVATTLHVPRALTVFVSKVTAPFNAYNPPFEVTPVVTVMDARATTFPCKAEYVPRVAELPTCQKTLQALAPFTNKTSEYEAVVRVDPIWKTHTLLGSACPSSVRIPVNSVSDPYV